MSVNQYIPVRHDLPCPVCGSVSWCMIHRNGEKVICPRTRSNEKYGEENYLHRVRGEQAKRLAEMIVAEPVTKRKNIDWNRVMFDLIKRSDPDISEAFAVRLGVDASVFGMYKCAAVEHMGIPLLYVPMQDGDNGACGIQTRDLAGGKRMIKHSHQGVMTPQDLDEDEDVLYVCEGFSDTAALASAGYYAIGRVSAKTCYEQTVKYIRARPYIERVNIIADRDESRTGLQGAARLGMVLVGLVETHVLMPRRHNDAREMWNETNNLDFGRFW